MSRHVVLALSRLFELGGIQRFNRMLCLALDGLADEMDLELTLLSHDDPHGPEAGPGRGPWKRIAYRPCGNPRRLAFETVSLSARRRPDLLLFGLLGMTPVGLACRPFVRRGYGFVAHGTESWNEPRLSRRIAARNASFALAVSADTARALAGSTGIAPEKVRLLPNTLEPSFELSPDDPAPEGDGIELLTVARLLAEEGQKGVDHALSAFAALADRYPLARYRIVGHGSDKERLVGLAARLGLGERVIFEQQLSDAELAERYRRASVFVLPSGQEGFGIVFLEAMRFAKPCVGGDAGGTPEVIEDGVTGRLVPFGDVPALVAVLDSLLGDRALRERYGAAGRRRLAERFTFDRFRERVAGHFATLLGG